MCVFQVVYQEDAQLNCGKPNHLECFIVYFTAHMSTSSHEARPGH